MLTAAGLTELAQQAKTSDPVTEWTLTLAAEYTRGWALDRWLRHPDAQIEYHKASQGGRYGADVSWQTTSRGVGAVIDGHRLGVTWATLRRVIADQAATAGPERCAAVGAADEAIRAHDKASPVWEGHASGQPWREITGPIIAGSIDTWRDALHQHYAAYPPLAIAQDSAHAAFWAAVAEIGQGDLLDLLGAAS